MAFSWFKDRRRQELLAEPFPAAWRQHLVDNVRHYAHLDSPHRAVVQAVVRVLVAEKHWTGGGGFAITDEMKVTVAAQASLLVLGLDEPYYFDRVQSIILYPGAYARPPQFQHYLNSPEGTHYLGEAWYHSPIVLSWRQALQAGRNASNGGNLVLHEFAHHLDGLDGGMNGTPPLAGREQENTWYRVTAAEYRRLVGKTNRHEVTLLDQYGATNKAEFFAVATECFFERPHAMRRQHEELYAVLREFYRQDPVQWLPDAVVAAGSRDQPAANESEPADLAVRSSPKMPTRCSRLRWPASTTDGTTWPRRPLREPFSSLPPTESCISIVRQRGSSSASTWRPCKTVTRRFGWTIPT